MIRFVRATDAQNRVWAIPDVSEKLNGAGVWLLANNKVVNVAIEQGVFKYGFRCESIQTSPSLSKSIEDDLRLDYLFRLKYADDSGRLIWGEDEINSFIEGSKQNMALPKENRSFEFLPPSAIIYPPSQAPSQDVEAFCKKYGVFSPTNPLSVSSHMTNIPKELSETHDSTLRNPFALRTSGKSGLLRSILRLSGFYSSDMNDLKSPYAPR
eukprot:TRINITY_DN10855_c0_g1_i1.p1 TRINITY_DN10855_c0_g1~~TRINITY_DN10855_c0_g1_i1.p1  ORF type:complete len:211 (+),score=33.78 TRINITY_DN10855_c0_g1_i1:166-798(+)